MKRLVQFEVRKIFSRRLAQAALAVLLLLSIFLALSTRQNMYASDGVRAGGRGKAAVEIEKAVAEKYAGSLTDEKVRQIMADFSPQSDLHGLNAKYLYQNSIQSAAFAHFSDLDGNWNGVSVSDVYGDEEIRVGYINGWLSSSQNMIRIFLVLSLVIVIMTAPIFSGEYGGVDNLILTSRYGKTKCTAAKVIAGCLAAMLVTAVVSAVNLLLALALYGSGGLDCSILFAPVGFAEQYIPFNITCGTLIVYQILLAFTGAISVTGITLLLSSVCKSQTVTLVASAAVYIFPIMLPVSETSPLFRYLVLLPLYHTQLISLMSIEQMRSGLLYAVWAIPVAILIAGTGILLSQRFFAKHQVT